MLALRVPKFGRNLPSKPVIVRESRRAAQMLLGIIIGAFGYAVFQVPHNISAGGIGSIALMTSHFSGHDVGLLFWLLNIPMITLGFFLLGRWPFVGRTIVASTIFSLFTSLFLTYLPLNLMQWPVTDNMLLNTIYGGLVGGIGGGLIYGAGGSLGGTAVIALVVQKKTGIPLSGAYLMTDGIIILALGIVFGWENAMLGLLMLLINGFATDYAMEGPSTVRTATVVTDQPKQVADALMATLNKGVSYWEIKGAYTDESRFMLMTTIYRNQVNDVQTAVAAVDDRAFVTIGVSHKAHGVGFHQLKANR